MLKSTLLWPNLCTFSFYNFAHKKTRNLNRIEYFPTIVMSFLFLYFFIDTGWSLRAAEYFSLNLVSTGRHKDAQKLRISCHDLLILSGMHFVFIYYFVEKGYSPQSMIIVFKQSPVKETNKEMSVQAESQS